MGDAYNMYVDSCNSATARALQLSQGMPAEWNIGPLIDLVSRAHAMGFDLVRMTQAQRQELAHK